MLTQDLLKELFDYNFETGKLIWKINFPCNRIKGCIAGSDNGKGRIKIGVNGKYYYAHILIWLWVYGKKPRMIDHKNNIKSDNRIENLRECSQSQNSANSNVRVNNRTSLYKGVCWIKWHQKYKAAICVNGRKIFLGYYDNQEDAALAYNKAAKKYFGDFARLNETSLIGSKICNLFDRII